MLVVTVEGRGGRAGTKETSRLKLHDCICPNAWCRRECRVLGAADRTVWSFWAGSGSFDNLVIVGNRRQGAADGAEGSVRVPEKRVGRVNLKMNHARVLCCRDWGVAAVSGKTGVIAVEGNMDVEGCPPDSTAFAAGGCRRESMAA